MSSSYFRRKAAESYRSARSSAASHTDHEALVKLGHGFKARATTARARLDRLQRATVTRQEVERQGTYWDSRE
jgi:hypothetical protein